MHLNIEVWILLLQITDLEQELFRKATKLKQLESQLAIAVGQISRQDSKISADVPDGTHTVSFRSKSSASGPVLEGYPACKGSPARTLSSDAGHFSNGDDSSSHSSENNHHRHMVDGAPLHQKHDASLPFSHSGQVHHGNETKLRTTSRTNRETDLLHSGNKTPSRSHRESQYVHHRRLGRTSSNPLDEGKPERSQRTNRRASHTSSEPLNRTLTSMDDYNMQSYTCSVMWQGCPNISVLEHRQLDLEHSNFWRALNENQLEYRWTWIWQTTVRQIFAYDERYAWSQSDAYQVFVICIRRILHMTSVISKFTCIVTRWHYSTIMKTLINL